MSVLHLGPPQMPVDAWPGPGFRPFSDRTRRTETLPHGSLLALGSCGLAPPAQLPSFFLFSAHSASLRFIFFLSALLTSFTFCLTKFGNLLIFPCRKLRPDFVGALSFLQPVSLITQDLPCASQRIPACATHFFLVRSRRSPSFF